MPGISIVICTYNRAESLRDTLESLICQSGRGEIEHEILVVDNHSKDKTRETTEAYTKSGHPVRYIYEGRQGVAYARNTGIREAKGPIIAFLDDDVIADTHWLEGMHACFRDTRALAVGGKIKRKWDCPRPGWYSEEIGGCLISQEWGEERKPWQTAERHMVTANMAFDKTVFERFGLFREELGRRGDELVGGEDRELYQRLVREGGKVMYEPKALAFHKVEKDRLTQEYFTRWFWDIGRTLGHEIRRSWHHALTVAPFWIWKAYTKALFKYWISSFKKPRSEAEVFASKMWVVHYGAMLRENYLHWLPFDLGRSKRAFKIQTV